MKRAILATSFTLVVFVVGTHSLSRPVEVVHAQPVSQKTSICQKTFTVEMAKRAARAVYAGTRSVHRHSRRMLVRILRCQRNPHARRFVQWYYHHQAGLHAHRVEISKYPMSYGLASWYYDAGSTASGYHAYYGVAVCGSGGFCVPFGTKIAFSYHGRTVIAVADDHGPYVGGRQFDLNQNTAAALGFGGVDTVGYRIGG